MNLKRPGRKGRRQSLGQCLHLGPAAGLHLAGAALEPVEEVGDLRLHVGCGARAGVGGDPFLAPGPDRLVGVEVGAVGGRSTRRSLPGVAGESRTASPPCAGPLSRITIRGPAWLVRNCWRKAALVVDELVPVSPMTSTSPVPRQTAE